LFVRVRPIHGSIRKDDEGARWIARSGTAVESSETLYQGRDRCQICDEEVRREIQTHLGHLGGRGEGAPRRPEGVDHITVALDPVDVLESRVIEPGAESPLA